MHEEHGDGIEVTDAQGRRYLDCLACAGALPLGHNPREIREHVERFLRSGQLQQALDIATLAAHAAVMGERLRQGLLRLQAAHGLIGDVRGMGLMLGAEMLEQPGLGTASAVAFDVKRVALEQGLIVEAGGRFAAVVRFLPPLFITAEQVDEVLVRFGRALQAVSSRGGAYAAPLPLPRQTNQSAEG